MLRFLGNIEAKLDTKGRVFVPAAFRKILHTYGETGLVLRKDIFQNCLVLYPMAIWNAEVSKLRSKLSRWGSREQQMFRQFVLGAESLELDASGRLLIPKRYQEMIGAVSDVCFLGVDDVIEIWAKDVLETTLISSEDFAEQLEQLMNDECE